MKRTKNLAQPYKKITDIALIGQIKRLDRSNSFVVVIIGTLSSRHISPLRFYVKHQLFGYLHRSVYIISCIFFITFRYEKEGRFRKQIKAQKLWFAILDSQIETGTPYMLYKDSCNRKSNQKVQL